MGALTVSEIFGPTIQGEGPSAGRRAGFVRLGRCNLDCSWCDTPYTWDWTGKNGTAYVPSVELRRIEVDEIVARIEAMEVPLAVITGGEPLIQATGLAALVPALMGVLESVEIETNGTRPPITYRPLRYNVSPKLASSGVARDLAWEPDVIAALAREDSVFKFVITTEIAADVAEVAEFADRFDIAAGRIWLMPEGTEESTCYDQVADAAIANGWNFTGRLHSLAWGATRAR